MRAGVRPAPASGRAPARRLVTAPVVLALALAATGCATPERNPAFRDPDPTSGHPPDFLDRDEFTHPASGDR